MHGFIQTTTIKAPRKQVPFVLCHYKIQSGINLSLTPNAMLFSLFLARSRL